METTQLWYNLAPESNYWHWGEANLELRLTLFLQSHAGVAVSCNQQLSVAGRVGEVAGRSLNRTSAPLHPIDHPDRHTF